MNNPDSKSKQKGWIPFQMSIFDLLKPKKKSRLFTAKRKTTTSVTAPELFEIWESLQQQYFPDTPHILEYTVVWSARSQKRVLASCNIKRKLVRVAREFKDPATKVWLEPLLYHEMCHAVLDPEQLKRKGKIRWHGKEFRTLELRHPRIQHLDSWIKEGGWRALHKRKRNPLEPRDR